MTRFHPDDTAGPLADDAASITLDEAILTAARQLTTKGRRRLLGIAGAPGAGKSTAAAAIAAALGQSACVVPMDGFHLANRQLVALGRHERKGAPDTFDVDGYRALLARLRASARGSRASTLYAPDFQRELEEPIAASIAVKPSVSLVITEGNYLLLDECPWRRVHALLDEVWFVGIETSDREARLVARHRHFGRGEREARAWIAATDAPNAARVEAVAHRADRRLMWHDRHLTFADG